MNYDQVIDFIKKECQKYKINFIIRGHGELKINNVKINGYFSHEKRELAISKSRDSIQWIYIAIHEYHHLLQFIQNPKRYLHLVESSIPFDKWLNGKDYNEDVINDHINNLIELEAECEQNTLQFIKKNNLDFDLKLQTKKANSYILFYHHVKKSGTWYDIGNEPYNNQKILNKMPHTFITDFKNPPLELLKVYNH